MNSRASYNHIWWDSWESYLWGIYWHLATLILFRGRIVIVGFQNVHFTVYSIVSVTIDITDEKAYASPAPGQNTIDENYIEFDSVSNHRRLHCLLNRLFMRRFNKNISFESLAHVRGLHRWPVNSPHEGPITQKMFPFDDVVMIHT